MTRKLSCPIPLDQIPCLCGSSCWLRLKSSSYQPPQYSHQGAVTISASSATIFINTRRLAFPCATAILDFALVEFLIFVPASTCIIPYHRTLFLARSASPARSKTSTLPLLLTLLHFRPTFSATYLKTSIARPISRWYTLPDLVIPLWPTWAVYSNPSKTHHTLAVDSMHISTLFSLPTSLVGLILFLVVVCLPSVQAGNWAAPAALSPQLDGVCPNWASINCESITQPD